jgi:hypothetical protein
LKLKNDESKAMTEIREIRKKLSEQMKGMSDKEILEFIKEKSAKVEKEYKLNLPKLQRVSK